MVLLIHSATRTAVLWQCALSILKSTFFTVLFITSINAVFAQSEVSHTTHMSGYLYNGNRIFDAGKASSPKSKSIALNCGSIMLCTFIYLSYSPKVK